MHQLTRHAKKLSNVLLLPDEFSFMNKHARASFWAPPLPINIPPASVQYRGRDIGALMFIVC